MRLLYTLILYLITPLILLYLLYRSLKNPQYRQRIAERWGYNNIPETHKNGIWIHCVSVGETLAAIPLIREIKKQYPNHPITITTTTPTGSERVQKEFKETIQHTYAPYDYPGAIKRFIKKTQPKLIIVMETELWPNMIAHSKKNKIPLIIANARLSKKSARKYAHYLTMISPMLKQITTIAAQTTQDAKRFHKLGAQNVTVTGNIKYDLTNKPEIEQQAAILRHNWGQERPVWIAASTHPGEEQDIIKAHTQILKTYPNALLLWAPRHPEKIETTNRHCIKANLKTTKHTTEQKDLPNTQVYIIDTLGELLKFYAASDIAFIGGSLIPHGGHNMLEAAAYSKPIITGPHTHNFHTIKQKLQKAEALIEINTSTALTLKLLELLANKDKGKQMGQAGKHVVEQNHGATQHTMDIINKLIKKENQESLITT